MSTAAPGAGVLARLAGDPAAFAQQVWGRRSLVRPAGDCPAGFEDLLNLDDVDHLVTETALRSPAYRLVRNGVPLPTSAYTRTAAISGVTLTGLVDPAKAAAEFEAGATIVLQGLHRFWAPVARLVRDLELELGHPCQVNAYITPPGSQGFAVHSDPHDVFVLQAFGRKTWEIHPSPAETADDPAATAREVPLEPGCVVYLPAGTPHAARTEASVSGHLTVGIRPHTWRRLVADAVAEALRADGQPAYAGLDAPLPLGHHRNPAALGPALGEHLAAAAKRLEQLDPRRVATEHAERFLTSRPPDLRGTLRDRLALRVLDDATRLRRRPGSVCELRPDGDRLRLLLGDRELTVPARIEPAVRLVAGRDELTPADLAGELDAQSRLVLARRLVREGLLEVVVG